MTIVERIAALATSIGLDVKALQEAVAELVSSSGGSVIQVATATVETDNGAKQPLLPAIPVGRKRIITGVYMRNSTVDFTTGGYDDGISFGFVSEGDYGNYSINTISNDTLVKPFDLIPNEVYYVPLGNAGDVFGVVFANTGTNGTVQFDVHYYDIDASTGEVINGSMSPTSSGTVEQFAKTTLNTATSTPQLVLAAVPTGRERVIKRVLATKATADLNSYGDYVTLSYSGSDIPFQFEPLVLPNRIAELNSATSGFFLGAAGDEVFISFADVPARVAGSVVIIIEYFDIDASTGEVIVQ